MLLTCKDFKISDFTWKKKFDPGNGGGCGGGGGRVPCPLPSPFLYGPGTVKRCICL